ncbi:hypothetical protein [Dialister micraerophilus]|uniref:hypothetical protein n=1 Tax=Dialister micraerophilus TaxID=309120 RepID=UPI0023F0D9ED|nr:hypothetical protein [Dialister micraerophilus]
MNNLAEKRKEINMQFTEIKKQIEFMMQENYEDFIKALISIELGIEDKNVLNKVYNKYMENDDVNLIDGNLSDFVDEI